MANIIENLNANEIDLGTLLGNDLVNDEYDDNPLITQAINCNYTDTTSLINQLPDDWRSSHNLLYVLHVNIQSLPAKFEKLKDIIIQFEERGLPLDVILICETFIRNENAKLYDIPGFNFVSKHRVIINRGGVGIYVRNSIKYRNREDLNIFVEGEFESVFIETTNTENSIIIGEIYRPPKCNTRNALQRFDDISQRLTDQKHVIIGSDSNFDLLKFAEYPPSSELLESIFSNSFLPTCTKPTRITHTSATLIDNLFIKYNNKYELRSGILVEDLSDHFPIYCILKSNKISKVVNAPLKFYSRKLSEAAMNSITRDLCQLDWTYLEEKCSLTLPVRS